MFEFKKSKYFGRNDCEEGRLFFGYKKQKKKNYILTCPKLIFHFNVKFDNVSFDNYFFKSELLMKAIFLLSGDQEGVLIEP